MLSLGDQWTTFEVKSTPSDVFYDDGRQKICTVSGNGALGVTAKGIVQDPSQDRGLTFCMKDAGKIKVIKLSPDCRIASIQREDPSIEFICFSASGDGSVVASFFQSTKLRTARIVGLEWIANNQILFVTNQGLELYYVNVAKKHAKLLKTCNISLSWNVYYPKSQLLIVSSGVSGSHLTPFLIQNSGIYRLAEFDVDFGYSNAKTNLSEREVSIASVYGTLYLMVFRYSLRDSSTLDVSLYKVSGDSVEKSCLVHTLALGMTGPFAVHVVDNVIIVHHQVSGSSLLFDIRLGDRPASGACNHRPLTVVSLSLSDCLIKGYGGDVPLYSLYWVMFPPNLVVDTSLGLFATVSLHPEQGEASVKDKLRYLQFLFNRVSSKNLLLDKLRILLTSNSLSLKEVASVFSWIFEPFQKATSVSKNADTNAKYCLVVDSYEQPRIDQSDLIGSVFLPAVESNSANKQFLMHCMLQYLLGLQESHIDVLPFFLNEVLVPTMVAAREFNRLQQLLQYRVIPDAKQLAFFLLSHEAKHAPLIQLAVDMLARLGTAAEEIVEVLLSKGHVVEAVRYLETTASIEKVNSLKLLECAWKENRQIRYAVFTYFQRLAKLRNNPIFPNAEQYDLYLRQFNELFGKEELEEAKHASQFAVLPREEKQHNSEIFTLWNSNRL